MLHSSFWIHSGEDLITSFGNTTCNVDVVQDPEEAEITAVRSKCEADFWDMVMRWRQTNLESKETLSRRSFRKTKKVEGDATSMPLEFLYPPQTITFLRKLSSQFTQSRPGLHAIRSHDCLTTVGKRSYASKTTNRNNDEESVFQDDGIEEFEAIEDEDGILEEEEENLDEESRVRRLNYVKRTRTTLPNTFEKLFKTPGIHTEHAWSIYRKAAKDPDTDLSVYKTKLLSYLNQSKIERRWRESTKIAESIGEEVRTAVQTRYYVAALMKLGDMQKAFQALQSNLNFCAHSRHAGFEKYIATTFNKGLWTLALSTWAALSRREGRIEQLNSSALVGEIEDVNAVLRKLLSFKDSETENLKELALLIWRGSKKLMTTIPNKKTGEEFRAARRNFLKKGDIVELSSLLEQRQWVDKAAKQEIEIMKSSGEQKEVDVRKQYLALREQKGVKPSLSILNAALKAFLYSGDLVNVQMVFEDHFRFGLRPDRLAYQSLLEDFANRGQKELVDMLFEQYSDRFEHPEKYYSYKLDVRIIRGEINEARQLLDQMPSLGYKHDIGIYNRVLYGYARSGDLDTTLQFYDLIQKRGMLPNARTITSIMYLAAKRGDVESVEKLFAAAQKQKFSITIEMYEILVFANCQAKDYARAHKIARLVGKLNLQKPLTKIWNTILAAQACMEDRTKLTETFRHMRTANIPFNTYTYAILMHSLCFVKKVTEAHNILNLFNKQKVEKNAVHYSILMLGYLRQKNYDAVYALFTEMNNEAIASSYAVQQVLIISAILEGASKMREKTVNVVKEILDLATSKLNALDLTSYHPVKSAIPPYLFVPVLAAFTEVGNHQEALSAYNQFLVASEAQAPNNAVVDNHLAEAAMEAYQLACDWVGLRHMWRIAKKSAIIKGRSIDKNKENTILPIHKHSLCRSLSTLIEGAISGCYTEDYHRVTVPEVIAQLKEITSQGFSVDVRIWNELVILLALTNNLKEAFVLCEHRLITPYFRRMQAQAQATEYVKRWPTLTELSKELGTDFTFTRTLETLTASFYWKFKHTRAEGEEKATELVRNLQSQCPKTFAVCDRLDDVEDIAAKNIFWRNFRIKDYIHPRLSPVSPYLDEEQVDISGLYEVETLQQEGDVTEKPEPVLDSTPKQELGSTIEDSWQAFSEDPEIAPENSADAVPKGLPKSTIGTTPEAASESEMGTLPEITSKSSPDSAPRSGSDDPQKPES